MGAVRSPRSGHTIQQLRALRESNWHNPDTGTELSAEESQTHLHRLEQKRADRLNDSYLKKMNHYATRSRGRPMIPPGQVIFRRIHGHVVPMRKRDEPWL